MKDLVLEMEKLYFSMLVEAVVATVDMVAMDKVDVMALMEEMQERIL